ncbi:hypothetical protein Osc7112_4231 [Oscillatoria nigro-viridis PCC 7112]|uniref:Uncharacterized protein n=1 Tax=Phormidium nigroviride PCC 7112 TaxID=179408 RepID=K9VM11_9CYAN|nr:hypothetical protein [Oscillatoria nigro-viridis]AFZ08554.1 hypothetical protein Osc7112_4231 [Oscillatoria nigro-viridis PCC 7112]
MEFKAVGAIGWVGAGFYNLSIALKDLGERAHTGLVKYSYKFVGAGSLMIFVTHR